MVEVGLTGRYGKDDDGGEPPRPSSYMDDGWYRDKIYIYIYIYIHILKPIPLTHQYSPTGPPWASYGGRRGPTYCRIDRYRG